MSALIGFFLTLPIAVSACAEEDLANPAVNLLPAISPVRLSQIIDEAAESEQVLIIDFWATWCVPCRRFFPILHAEVDALGPGIRLVTISIDKPARRKKATGFVATHDALHDAFWAGRDPDKLAALGDVIGMEWQSGSVPALAVFDASGRLVGEFTDFRVALQDLLATSRKAQTARPYHGVQLRMLKPTGCNSADVLPGVASEAGLVVGYSEDGLASNAQLEWDLAESVENIRRADRIRIRIQFAEVIEAGAAFEVVISRRRLDRSQPSVIGSVASGVHPVGGVVRFDVTDTLKGMLDDAAGFVVTLRPMGGVDNEAPLGAYRIEADAVALEWLSSVNNDARQTGMDLRMEETARAPRS